MVELIPFQEIGVRRIYRFKGKALLADEQGLGKTIQALSWIARIKKRRPVVIVAPASVKYTWQAEAALHFNLRIEVLEGFCSKRHARSPLPGNIVVLNYDILSSWLPRLLHAKVKVLILDECQRVKSVRAQRTKAARKLARKADSVVALSGTPLTNRPEELWSVLNIIRPDIFPERLKYLWRYCEPRHTKWGWKFDGATRLPELHRILKEECMIRRLKKQVAPELPDKIHKIVPFKLESYEEYNKAKNDFLRWLKSVSLSKADRAKKSLALSKVGYLLRLCARLKLEWTVRWLEDFVADNPGKKLVCMSMHTFVIDHLRDHFPDSVVINGKVRGRKREDAKRAFQNNKKITFLFGNWKAAGVGLTLISSHILVSLDFPWTAGDLAQGQDRIHRIGQKETCFIYYLMLLNTIEEKLFKGLKKKQEVLDAVLDGKKNKDFDMLELILKEMKDEPN